MAKPITSIVRLGKMRICLLDKSVKLPLINIRQPTEVIHITLILPNTLLAQLEEVLRIALINRVRELMEKKANNKNRH